MLVFRNIDATPDDPVVDWGVEGLLTAIERGSLSHWRQIVAQLKRTPTGEFREDLEEALEMAEMGGVHAIGNVLRRMDETPEERVARRMRTAFHQTGMSQEAVAKKLGTSQSRLSTYLSGRVCPSAAVLDSVERLAEQRRLMLV